MSCNYRKSVVIEEHDSEIEIQNFCEIQDGIEQLGIGFDSFLGSSTNRSIDTGLSGCLSNDLLKRLEENSPVCSRRQSSEKISSLVLDEDNVFAKKASKFGRTNESLLKDQNATNMNNLGSYYFADINAGNSPISNNFSNFGNCYPNTSIQNSGPCNVDVNACKDKSNYMYGKPGWTCGMCRNFNFELRMKCNRCGKNVDASLIKNSPNKAFASPENFNAGFKPSFDSQLRQNSGTSTCDSIPAFNPNMNNKMNNEMANDLNSNSNFNLMSNGKMNSANCYSTMKLNPELLNSVISNYESSKSAEMRKKKKPFVERMGDWACIKCKNMNFAFRSSCNKCNLTKVDSDMLFNTYMKNVTIFMKMQEMAQSKNKATNVQEDEKNNN